MTHNLVSILALSVDRSGPNDIVYRFLCNPPGGLRDFLLIHFVECLCTLTARKIFLKHINVLLRTMSGFFTSHFVKTVQSPFFANMYTYGFPPINHFFASFNWFPLDHLPLSYLLLFMKSFMRRRLFRFISRLRTLCVANLPVNVSSKPNASKFQ